MKSFKPLNKTKSLPRFVLLVSILFCSAHFANAFAKAHYGVLHISGLWQTNKTGFMSQPLYYEGYDKCEEPDYKFFSRAEDAFAKFLVARYDEVPDDIGENHISLYDTKKYSNSAFLETYNQAQQRTDELMAAEKSEGYSSIVTTFTFEHECE